MQVEVEMRPTVIALSAALGESAEEPEMQRKVRFAVARSEAEARARRAEGRNVVWLVPDPVAYLPPGVPAGEPAAFVERVPPPDFLDCVAVTFRDDPCALPTVEPGALRGTDTARTRAGRLVFAAASAYDARTGALETGCVHTSKWPSEQSAGGVVATLLGDLAFGGGGGDTARRFARRGGVVVARLAGPAGDGGLPLVVPAPGRVLVAGCLPDVYEMAEGDNVMYDCGPVGFPSWRVRDERSWGEGAAPVNWMTERSTWRGWLLLAFMRPDTKLPPGLDGSTVLADVSVADRAGVAALKAALAQWDAWADVPCPPPLAAAAAAAPIESAAV